MYNDVAKLLGKQYPNVMRCDANLSWRHKIPGYFFVVVHTIADPTDTQGRGLINDVVESSLAALFT